MSRRKVKRIAFPTKGSYFANETNEKMFAVFSLIWVVKNAKMNLFALSRSNFPNSSTGQLD